MMSERYKMATKEPKGDGKKALKKGEKKTSKKNDPELSLTVVSEKSFEETDVQGPAREKAPGFEGKD